MHAVTVLGLIRLQLQNTACSIYTAEERSKQGVYNVLHRENKRTIDCPMDIGRYFKSHETLLWYVITMWRADLWTLTVDCAKSRDAGGSVVRTRLDRCVRPWGAMCGGTQFTSRSMQTYEKARNFIDCFRIYGVLTISLGRVMTSYIVHPECWID